MIRKSFYCALWHIVHVFGRFHVFMAKKCTASMQELLEKGSDDEKN